MSHEGHHELEMSVSNGEVREIPEESVEIGSMHIEQESESNESRRQRTESTTSVSSESWQNNDEMMSNLRRAQGLLDQGSTPLQIIRQIFPEFEVSRISMMSERAHFAVLSDLLERAPIRQKLSTYNSLADAVELFKTRNNVLVLTGAGVSVSCGIPDFRSKDGIYARLRSEFPDLPDPTAMFDIRYFKANPAPFYNFAREIFPGQFVPSVSHRFIKELESTGRLLRNYTQNIDTLEHQTGIKRVVECHGSFSKCTCTQCGHQYDGNEIREEVLAMRVAHCKLCQGVIKPNIVFFGEDLGRDFHRYVTEDKGKVDLIVVIGSSLKVRPVALIPHCVGKDVPQILINRESLPHYNADIELLGNCDDILRDICFSLGGSFSEMIASYDSIIEQTKQNVQMVSRNKRQLISQEQFLSICLKEKNGPMEKETDGGEPTSKRPRMSNAEETMDTDKNNFQEIQKHNSEDDEDTRNSDDVMTRIKHPRLLNITDMLHDNKCVAISAYQTVFPGAECSFDMETLKLVRDVHPHNQCTSSCGSSSSSSASESETQANPISRAQSLDDIVVETRKVYLSNLQRSDSCDSDLQYELSETIDPETFSALCEQMRI